MHRIRCLTVSAVGGFKINGPPKNGKGPMSQGNNLGTRDETSLPQPTQAGRIETCTELIRQAMRCLENNDKQCAMRLIEELVKNQCHNGNAVGREVVGKVKGVVHELWLASSGDNEFRCELLTILRDLGISRTWVGDALGMGKNLNRWIAKCGVRWEGKVRRKDIVKAIESLLREKFGWDENKMCETLLMYIGVDAEMLRRYGIEPCDWVHADFDEVYFMGIALSDLHVRINKIRKNEYINMKLGTSNAIDAVLFPLLLQPIQRPSIAISWNYIANAVEVQYSIDVEIDKWGWLNREELIKRIRALKPEEVPRLISGAIDGDGTIIYKFKVSTPYIEIGVCKACKKRVFLDIIEEALKKLGIKGKIYETDHDARLMVYGKDAIKLLRLIMPYLHHPLKRLRARLILMLHDGKIDYDTFVELYGQTKYGDSDNDPKRKRAISALARAAPQTHTHGVR